VVCTFREVTSLLVRKQGKDLMIVVMDNLPKEEWCQCGPKVTFEDKEYPPKAGTAK
jgi:hypothetical protein